ncbi:nucleoside-diphosphate sugar epimerase/dehydratase [Thiohalobacter sp. IOR34]|uniref:polysaccharide biosynthesis protein n=1 Tax=Thiohalobacter sp. IOR34 TaxID=3057176 RepID=UPI0025B0BCAE|nr:nucleoside-diphosphate sugar epimerase/dehydratase [Thiohalobacter sp. IOR34]WJW76718.1 nucleoside-diphosphate sugar epimerase/dehydratase [Thiohalobacter sp. IOR34]
MKLLERLRSPLIAFVHDLLMVPLAWFGAYWLRFNLGSIPQEQLVPAWTWLPAVLLIQGLTFVYLGLYRGHWRFASLPDLLRILKAAGIGTLGILVLLVLATRLQDIPRSVFPLYAVLLTAMLAGPRLFYRWLKDRKLYLGQGRRVLIAGAGRAGEMLVRDLLRDPERSLEPVGFVDDDPKKRGIDIHGIRVLGASKRLPALVETHEIDLVLLAMPSARSPQIRKVVEYCEAAGVPFRMLPRMADLVAGRVSVEAMREVSIEDLLGRDPVELDQRAIHAGLSGRRVLISGGGGSIGSELCRQVARLGPRQLIVFEKSEFNLYQIEMELRRRFPQLEIIARLGDVADAAAVDKLFSDHQPQVVLHAAAYKHVPMLENQAREAVMNNVCGTRTLALAADRHGSEIFVLVSTDKAVNPANVMGASKRMAEIFCQNFARRSRTRFITVRFGNVLGSAGSVVPLFKQQIENGGPVTVTDPEMIRYFMTIPEACQLILQAGVMGQGGEIYVLDMGEPVKITYLAEQMIRLAGREPGKDIEIVFTGLRPGEKLYEELFHEQEALQPTGHAKIRLARHRSLDWEALNSRFEALEAACRRFDEAAVREGIEQLVPELHSENSPAPDNVVSLNQRENA